MKRAAMIMLAGSVASPALSQHEGHTPAPAEQAQHQGAAEAADRHAGHDMPQEGAPADRPADPHSGHDMGPAQAAPVTTDPHPGHDMPASEPSNAPAVADPHAGHVMPQQEADPHAGHNMPEEAAPVEQPADPHAGHRMGLAQTNPVTADPHGGHDMGAARGGAPNPPAGPPPQEAFSGLEHAADAFYGTSEMAAARMALGNQHGNMPAYRILLDRLEAQLGEGRDSYAWDAQAWYGGDIDKLWLKSEGGGEFGGGIEEVELQALWSRAIDPWFDLQLGVRQDLQPGADRTYFVTGIQGLAPYWFEVEGFAFVSNKGDVTLRFEGEYDLRLTQALILQPRTEFDLALQNIPELQIGSGLSTASIGARLRYEFLPSSGPAVIAPYLGVQYERAFGNTADFYRAADEDVEGLSVLVGVRTWF